MVAVLLFNGRYKINKGIRKFIESERGCTTFHLAFSSYSRVGSSLRLYILLINRWFKFCQSISRMARLLAGAHFRAWRARLYFAGIAKIRGYSQSTLRNIDCRLQQLGNTRVYQRWNKRKESVFGLIHIYSSFTWHFRLNKYVAWYSNITKCRFFISFLSVSFRKLHSLYKNIQVYTSIFFGWTHPLRGIFRLNYIKWHVFRGSHIDTLFISVDNRLHFTEKRCFRFVSQSTDFSFRFVPFRFAKYRFSISFRKVQIFHFVSSHFVSQSTISRRNLNWNIEAKVFKLSPAHLQKEIFTTFALGKVTFHDKLKPSLHG